MFALIVLVTVDDRVDSPQGTQEIVQMTSEVSEVREINHQEHARLLKGKIQLAEEAEQRWRRRLAAWNHRERSLRNELNKVVAKILKAHEDSGSGIEALRDERRLLNSRLEDHQLEEPMLLKRIEEAKQNTERLQIEVAVAERRLVQKEGEEVAAELRRKILELDPLVERFKALTIDDRRLKDCVRGVQLPVASGDLSYVSGISHLLTGQIDDVVRQAARIEKELTDRRLGIQRQPGEYSMSQQRKKENGR